MRTRELLLSAPAAALLAVASPAPAAPAEVDLVGTWHVLIHYRDDGSANPERERWDDKVWVFERTGDRLRWTEFPIVVFEDESGRFERRPTGQYARILHFWEPDPAQIEDIRDGLQVNTRGSKFKTLLSDKPGEWRSTSMARPASALVITYTENWSIEGMPAKPVFTRQDLLGSASAETLEGITRYTTTSVEAEGDLLRGTYERDGTRHGTFRMMRSGATEGVRGSGKTQGERLMEAWFGQWAEAMMGGEAGLKAEIERRISEGEMELSEEARADVRRELRRTIEDHMRSQQLDPRQFQGEVDSLIRRIEEQIFEQGRSVEEIGQMLKDGKLQP